MRLKIVTGTFSYVKVEIEGKIVKIQGEMIVGGFAAYAATIKHWEPPYKTELIDEPTKQYLIEEIEAEAHRNKYKITFELAVNAIECIAIKTLFCILYRLQIF